MYTHKNYQTKKALKDDLASGKEIGVYQPNGDLTGFTARRDGWVGLEGPHYPEAHKWYAEAWLENGRVAKIK